MRITLTRLAMAIGTITLLSPAAHAQPASIEGIAVTASECGTGASSDIVTDKPGGGLFGNRLVGFGESDNIILAKITGTSAEDRKAGYSAAVTYDRQDSQNPDLVERLREGIPTEFERLNLKYFNATRLNTPISKIWVKATFKMRVKSPYGEPGAIKSFNQPLALNPNSIPSSFRPNSWAEGTILASNYGITRFSPRLLSVVVYLKSKDAEQIYFGDLEVRTKGLIRVEQLKTAKHDDCDLFN
jgi:hypothetical protein